MKTEEEVREEINRLQSFLSEKKQSPPSSEPTVIMLQAGFIIELRARINMLNWVLTGTRQ
jgi:hypothetical protein